MCARLLSVVGCVSDNYGNERCFLVDMRACLNVWLSHIYLLQIKY